ncbi:phosphatidylinositol N-acetylglucosaminyltransferase subunit C isoform X3 [Oryzias latipes]
MSAFIVPKTRKYPVYSRVMGPDSAPGQTVPWRKVLWEPQPYPDNYVDHHFLEELRRNEGIRQYRYWAVVKEAGFVGQQMSSVAIFLTLWLYMEQGLLAPGTLLWSSLVCALLGYGLHQTLTESVSTDTVYAMSAVMLLAHLVAFPYAQPSPPGSLSLNAALFASVCLASRLPGSLHTFAMLSCALLVFALWPCLLQRLRENAPGHFPGACVGVCIGGVGGLGSQSVGGALLLFLALASVTFLCPLLLVRLQRHKDNIHGPWDEAEIHEDLSRLLG